MTLHLQALAKDATVKRVDAGKVSAVETVFPYQTSPQTTSTSQKPAAEVCAISNRNFQDGLSHLRA